MSGIEGGVGERENKLCETYQKNWEQLKRTKQSMIPEADYNNKKYNYFEQW